jgi:hypothetical protein
LRIILKKPDNIPEYKKWLLETHSVESQDLSYDHYDAVSTKIKYDFKSSMFWTTLTGKLLEFDQEYLLDSDYNLLLSIDTPELLIKPFSSFMLKTYRKNILNNEDYPNEPNIGWILPNNWYAKIEDIVRTYFVVKYLDGVDFLIGRIKNLCEDLGKECRVDMEAREEGYYAAHVYIMDVFEIPERDWGTKKSKTSIEIQITTQLQENIRKLLHNYYEQRRKMIKRNDIKWQWDYLSDEFSANYLGHILHYIEGMIMEIREKQKELKT